MTASTLPVSRVVSVTVSMSPTAAAGRNFGAMLMLGASDVIDTDERMRVYSSIDDIATDFGTDAPEYLGAQAFFAQSPQPSTCYVGRWAKTATSGLIKGRILAQSQQEISLFQSIEDGAFDVTIDGSVVNVTSVNLSSASNINAVASAVTEKLQSKGTCLWMGDRFVIRSATTGTTSTVSTISNTGLSAQMGLDSGTTLVNGAQAESLEDALVTLLDYPSWYGLYLCEDCEDDDIIAAANLIQAASPSRIMAFTTADTAELDGAREDTLCSKLKSSGINRAIAVYTSSGQAAGASVLGRMATVNFNGSNTTITLKFKQLPGVPAENLRTSHADSLKDKNCNVFAAYQNDTSILQEGITCGGWFIDETHGLDWLQDAVQTAVWNLLYTSTTKIGQDEAGSTAIVSCISRVLDQAVTNGLVAPGVWQGEEFGELSRGDTLSTGYYVYIQPLAEQLQADREARKAPPVQIAVKLRGAIHFVDVSIIVNR